MTVKHRDAMLPACSRYHPAESLNADCRIHEQSSKIHCIPQWHLRVNEFQGQPAEDLNEPLGCGTIGDFLPDDVRHLRRNAPDESIDRVCSVP
jgi:hypothetical protein